MRIRWASDRSANVEGGGLTQPAIAIKIARPNLTDELGWHPAPGWNGVVLPA